MANYYLTDSVLADLIAGIHCEQCGGTAHVFYDYPREAFKQLENITESDYNRALFGMGLSDYDRLEYDAFRDEFLSTNWLTWWDSYHEEEDANEE